jgi:hydroxymethylpyrimidine kinase/phosphomethylpyrimidine kinase
MKGPRVAEGNKPIALTIAGSDSGGGAGIQADLKTFQAFDCFGTSVIVAVTAQNTLGVRAVHPIPDSVIVAQVEALSEDLPPDAVKSGMLATRELVELVAHQLASRAWSPYVLDPVMVASSGDRLLDGDAVIAVRDRLVPLTNLVTPNLDEAELLTGMTVRSPGQMVDAGKALVDLGAGAALVKGGHLQSDIMVDVLVIGNHVERFTRSRLDTRNTHGTGCTLSAAVTAGLAREESLEESVLTAIEYLQEAIKSAPDLGSGFGPVDHNIMPR